MLHYITAKCNKESPITTMRSLIQRLRLKSLPISEEIVLRHIAELQQRKGNFNKKNNKQLHLSLYSFNSDPTSFLELGVDFPITNQ